MTTKNEKQTLIGVLVLVAILWALLLGNFFTGLNFVDVDVLTETYSQNGVNIEVYSIKKCINGAAGSYTDNDFGVYNNADLHCRVASNDFTGTTEYLSHQIQGQKYGNPNGLAESTLTYIIKKDLRLATEVQTESSISREVNYDGNCDFCQARVSIGFYNVGSFKKLYEDFIECDDTFCSEQKFIDNFKVFKSSGGWSYSDVNGNSGFLSSTSLNNGSSVELAIQLFGRAEDAGTSGYDLSIDLAGFDVVYPEVLVFTCEDGVQNQDETGIDCGGVCPACDNDPPDEETPEENGPIFSIWIIVIGILIIAGFVTYFVVKKR